MTNLGYLALRYLLWMIGLRILYIAAVNFLFIPNSLGSAVILASVPAMDIGRQAVLRATAPLEFADWAKVWAVMISVYLIVNVILIAMLVPAFRAAFADPVGLQLIILTSGGVALLLALFLWIGARIGARG
ncbi:hypothetical protein [Jannaschia sp. CCS1]|uniref:hypothetical protein n=1 Tax=Jannaschia sp. (strain CCS1) TaxID=290400 RepID=UPI000053B904|nr:hypothetical protein [Jannaschia sp. CCS1]ABD54751.1 hypothetical protein Jann_1834 [Jannaschia sp. CCS1]